MKQLLILPLLLTTSCVSMFVRPLYTKVDMTEVDPGVKVQVLEDGHVASETVAPASVLVRTKDRVVFRFSKEGYEPVSIRATVKHDFALRFLSLFVGCTLSLCVGTFIDEGTGAMNNIEPRNLKLTLQKTR